MDNKFSFILPIKLDTSYNFIGHADKVLNTKSNLERVIDIQLRTFEKFLVKEDLDNFYIVCVPNELELIKEKLKSYDFPFVFINEDDLVEDVSNPDLWEHIVPSWRTHIKQEFIKLALTSHSTTEHNITLDADVILTKEFGYNEMFHDGKLLLAKVLDFTRPQKPEFFQYATAILDTPDDKRDEMRFRSIMGVTPQILLKSEKLITTESEIRKAIREGMDPQEAYLKYSVF